MKNFNQTAAEQPTTFTNKSTFYVFVFSISTAAAAAAGLFRQVGAKRSDEALRNEFRNIFDLLQQTDRQLDFFGSAVGWQQNDLFFFFSTK